MSAVGALDRAFMADAFKLAESVHPILDGLDERSFVCAEPATSQNGHHA